jgi:hypothetical protein
MDLGLAEMNADPHIGSIFLIKYETDGGDGQSAVHCMALEAWRPSKTVKSGRDPQGRVRGRACPDSQADQEVL